MSETNDAYLAWMRDARASAQQALTLMNGLEAHLQDWPELRDRVRTHIGETEQQARALAGLLDPSGLSDDRGVKGVLGSYRLEHMEIVPYRILIAAAKLLEDHEAVAVFQRSLAEEQAMSDWLAAHVDSTVREYLRREMTATAAC